MNSLLQQMLDFFRQVHRRNGRRRTVLTAMAAVVVFATTYALILPAITLDEDTANDTPGVEVEDAASGEGNGAGEIVVNDIGVAAGDSTQGASSAASEGGGDAAAQGNDSGNGGGAAASSGSGSAEDGDASSDKTPVAGELEAETQLQTDDGAQRYMVKVSYGADAGVPANVSLKVKILEEDSDDREDAQAFAEAKDAVVSAKKADDQDYDENTLGITALDIAIVDADGNEIEPTGKVDVKIDLPTLPEDAVQEDNYDVQHIVDVDTARENGVEDVDKKATDEGLVAETVAEGVEYSQATDKTTAEFATTSFSTYTITWTKGGSGDDANLRTGYVNIHYVNQTGGVELDATTVPASSMMAKTSADDNSAIVDLADWAASSGSSRVDGYTYLKATVGTRTGTEITGLKVVQNTSTSPATYQLYYTTSSTVNANSKWTAYTDSISGDATSNAEVYLFFSEDATYTVPLTVHYVDKNGNPLTDANGAAITKVVDIAALSTSSSSNNGFADMASTSQPFLETINGYSFDTSKVNAAGGSFIYAGTTDASTTLTFTRVSTQGGDINAGKVPDTSTGPITGAFFRFIRYDSSNDRILVARAGGAQSYSVSGGDWGLYFTYKVADTLNVTVHHVDAEGNTIAEDTAVAVSNGGTVSVSNAQTISGYTAQNTLHYGGYNGTNFTSMAYAKGDAAWTSAPDSGSATASLVDEVWIVYDKQPSMNVTVHHVDSEGNEVAVSTTETVMGGTSLSADSISKPSGLDTGYDYTLYYKTGESSTQAVSSIDYTYTAGTGTWSSTYTTSSTGPSTSTGDVVKDVYLQYTPKTLGVTVHHVNQLGTEIAPATTKTVSSGESLTADSIAKPNSRTSGYGYSLYYKTNEGSTQTVSSISYTYTEGTGGAAGSWSSTPDSGTATSGLVRDVYLLYTPTTNAGLKIYYVDESGGMLHASATDSNSIYQNSTWDGWTLPRQNNISDIGSYQYAYLGVFGQSSYYVPLTGTGDKNNAAMYKKDSDGTWHTGYGVTTNATTKAATTEVYASDGTSPILLTDVFQVYGGTDAKKGVTVHYVDTAGNIIADDTYTTLSSGDTLTAANAATAISGYGYQAAHFGSVGGTEFTKLTFTYDSSKTTATERWSSTYVTGSSTTESEAKQGDTAVNDIWLVYKKFPVGTTTFNVHHVYMDTSGSTTELATESFALASDQTVKRLNTTAEEEEKAALPTGSGGLVKTDLTNAAGSKLTYSNTRIGTASGFEATAVYVDTDGTPEYLNGDAGSASVRYVLSAETGSTSTWSASAAEGRNFILSQDADGNMTLIDSQHGSLNLNATGTGTYEGSGDTYTVYTATFHGEEETTTYRAYKSGDGSDSYVLEVANYIPNKSKDIYLVYIDSPSEDGGKIWIDDNLKYTGMLDAKTSGVPTTNNNTLAYEWHRVVTGAGASATSTTRSTEALGDAATSYSVQYAAGSDGTIVTMRAYKENVSTGSGSSDYRTDLHSSATLALSDGSTVTVTRTDNGSDNSVSYAVTKTDASGTTTTVDMPSAGASTTVTVGDTTVTISLDSDDVATIATTASGGTTPTTTTTLTQAAASTTTDVQDVALNTSQRKQTGDHWNIAANAADRTWLDLEADEGSDTWTYGTTVKYYVTVSYQPQQEPTAHASSIFTVDYYGQLENSDFERPNYDSNSASNQVTNEAYKAAGGVWQSTGTGTEQGGPTDVSIEIANTNVLNSEGTAPQFLASYAWYGDNDVRYKADGVTRQYAVDGDQFAELNCSVAGALYQDVITHPNETLSYWFSHRARGQNQTANPEYDSMYLVIMPTKLAMTSAADGTELVDQSDLIDFIEAHGGFSYAKPGAEDDQITYYDEENGILIRRVSSDDQDWHNISVTNGYTAKGGLTRFFFVAGPTSWPGESGGKTAVEGATHGNFLDAVGFSQELPEPAGFNMTVSKTFSGLTQAQLADLAATKTDGTDATSNDAPFTFTITDTYQQDNQSHMNPALAYAELQFTATSTGTSTYSYALTATQYQKTSDGGTTWAPIPKSEYDSAVASGSADNYRAYDLLAEVDGNGNKKNSAVARINSDGSVTMTWTFVDQALASYASDLVFNYTVAESNYDVSGLLPTHTYALNGGATESGTSGMIPIRQGNSARYAFANSYTENTGNPSQITVTKTFSGVTRTTVEKLLAGYTEEIEGTTYSQDPYVITLTKTTDDKGSTLSHQPTIELTPTNTGTVTLGSGENAQEAVVSYSLSEDTANGKVTLTWVIQEVRPDGTASDADDIWMGGPGTYTASESNYTPTPHASVGDQSDQNELRSVEVNGYEFPAITPDPETKAIDLGTVHVGKVGDSSYAPTMSGDPLTSGVVSNPSGDIALSSAANLIIGRTNDNGGQYVVWTNVTAGANLRQAVIDYINGIDGLGTGTGGVEATFANTSFRSGANPGTLKYNTAHSDTTMTYNGGTTVTFANEAAEAGATPVTWTAAYATSYSLDDKADGSYKNNATELRVANGYEPIVKVLKADANDTAVTLSGAVFNLYKYGDDQTTKRYLISTATSSTNDKEDNWKTEAEIAAQASYTKKNFTTTTVTGVSIGKLAPGTYYLTEAKAPDGYNYVPDIMFTVAADGTVAVGTDGSQDHATITWNDPYYTITVKDVAGIELPNTGGAGAMLLRLAGVVLVALAAAGAFLRRRGPRFAAQHAVAFRRVPERRRRP